MTKELAKTLTTALVQFIDEQRPEGTMCCSNAECKSIEQMLEGEQFDIVEAFIKNKLTRLTEFEKRVRFIMDEFSAGRYSADNIDDVRGIAKGLLDIAKKDMPMPEDTIIFQKGVEEGRRLQKESSHEDYILGYTNGYKDAERQYNESVAYHFPIMPQRPLCYELGGTCTNPFMDCINCPKKNTGGGFTTSSGTATSTLHYNTSATDGKEHNPSFTD